MKKIRVYTDGACSGNPGPGGWGFVVVEDEEVKSKGKGSEPQTTNNRMELTAAIRAIESLEEGSVITIITDSKYLCDAFRQDWISNWIANDWKNSKKKDVKNRDLWETLIDLANAHEITWEWVHGHRGNQFNEMADSLATEAKDQ